MLRIVHLITVLVAMGLALTDLAGAVSHTHAAAMTSEAHAAVLHDASGAGGPCPTCPDGALACQQGTCRIANAAPPVLHVPDADAAVRARADHTRLTGQHPKLDLPPPEL